MDITQGLIIPDKDGHRRKASLIGFNIGTTKAIIKVRVEYFDTVIVDSVEKHGRVLSKPAPYQKTIIIDDKKLVTKNGVPMSGENGIIGYNIFHKFQLLVENLKGPFKLYEYIKTEILIAGYGDKL